MSKKVLFLQPLHEKIERTARTNFAFPFGLGYLSTILEENGYRAEILDAHALQLSKEEVVAELKEREFDILGLSAFSTQYHAVKVIAKFVREQLGKKVIVGGPLATYSWELTLKNCPVDVCVLGEGENTLLELIKNLDQPEHYKNIAGIAFLNNNQVVRTIDRPYIGDLDKLPRPAYHLFEMEKYVHASVFRNRRFTSLFQDKKLLNKRVINFITSRGCPYNCKFCSRNFRLARYKSIDKIIEELRYLKEKFRIDGIHFSDELFVLSKERMKEFVRKLKPLNLFWNAQARANLVDFEMLKIMKNGGCLGIGLGIESGSQKILNNINKAITVEQVEAAMKAAKKLNLGVKVQLIFGYPGEDEQTIQETIEMFKRIDHPGRRFNLITPIPGSPLYEECLAQGLIKDEDEYLTGLEKSFGKDKVQINFTKWPDDELIKKMRETAMIIKNNYLKRYFYRYFYWKFSNLIRKLSRMILRLTKA